MRTVLVCGSRKYTARDSIYLALLCEEGDIEVIHGAAPGADTLADSVAKELGYPVRSFPAEWQRHGRAAGPIRNRRMLDEEPDVVLAFGRGRGTDDAVGEAEKRGIPVRRFA